MIALLYPGCGLTKKKPDDATSSSSEPPATASEAPGVSVSGDIPDASSVDFIEAEDSVQISGVNLTTSAKTVSVDAVSISTDGVPQLSRIQSMSTSEKSFRFTGLPFETYLVIRVDDKPTSVIQPVNVPGNGATNVGLYAPMDATAVVTSRMFSLIVETPASAKAASSLLADGLLNLPELAVTAGSMVSGYQVKKAAESGSNNSGNAAAAPLDLAGITSIFVAHSNEDRLKLPEADRPAYAKALSRVAAGTMNRSKTRIANSYAAAHIASLEVKRQTKEIAVRSGLGAVSPAEKTIREVAKTNPEVFISYTKSQEVYVKYAVEIDSSGEPPPTAQSEYQNSSTADYNQYAKNPETFQNYMNDYTPPQLPDSYPEVPSDPGSYTAVPTPSPSPSPDATPGPGHIPDPEQSPSPDPTPTPTPTPDPTPTPEDSPGPETPPEVP